MNQVFIGDKLREFRLKKDLTLVELSKLTGVQIATLSRIENNKMTGTVSCHSKIAYILGINIEQLYKDIVVRPQKVAVFQELNPSKDSKTGKSTYQTLTPDASSRKLCPTLITIEPNGRTNEDRAKSNTEQFIYVLEGTAEAVIDKDTFTLKKETTLYFDASKPHYFKNVGKREAKLISVRTQV